MKKTTLIFVFVLLIFLSSVLAISKPTKLTDPIKMEAMDITPPPDSIVGTECSNIYSTTGDYCSAHLRIYYQCLPHLDGNWYEQRTENCESYDGRCSIVDGKATCVDYPGSSPYSRNLFIAGLIITLIIALGGVGLVKVTKQKVWYGLLIIAGLTLSLTITRIIVGGI